jgi:flagellar hook-basal body complex protein FliE
MINKILLREVQQHSTSILNKDGQRQREQRRRDKGDAFVQTLNKATKAFVKTLNKGEETWVERSTHEASDD